jgi:hypothetical protein
MNEHVTKQSPWPGNEFIQIGRKRYPIEKIIVKNRKTFFRPAEIVNHFHKGEDHKNNQVDGDQQG